MCIDNALVARLVAASAATYQAKESEEWGIINELIFNVCFPAGIALYGNSDSAE